VIARRMGIDMEMERVFRMNAGLGDSSYAQNSILLQRRGLEIVEPVLEEAILSMKMMSECNTFCIADLGCSSGPNALFTAENITKTLKAKYMSAGIPVPQCQVFFNDLPASDFNSLFRILPSFSVNTDHQNEEGVAGRSYFAAGVPGSFYGRLFPDKALHFVHSSFGLHWLSQVPAEILEKNPVTWNKGKIFCGGESQAVGEAYFRQFQKDFNTFLRARADEMVGGGRMLLLLLGRTPHDPIDQGYIALQWELLEISLNDLVKQGLIEEEKVDSFNIPMYCPCPEEVSNEVAREGSFEIQRLELLRRSENFPREEMEAITGSASAKDAYGKKLAKQLRAVMESLMKHHFGEEIMDALFERYGEILGRRLSERIEYGKRGGYLVLVLQRR
jgi:jasmonate O-methyltransferase